MLYVQYILCIYTCIYIERETRLAHRGRIASSRRIRGLGLVSIAGLGLVSVAYRGRIASSRRRPARFSASFSGTT
jgi:hypothetical protein